MPETPQEFLAALERIRQEDADKWSRLGYPSYASSGFDGIVRFNSNGGNLVAAMNLGKEIRALKLDTEVGYAMVRHYEKDEAGGPKNPDTPQPSSCFSACVYAFLGGVNRIVGPRIPAESDPRESKMGIHQFYGKEALTDPEGKTFSATDAAAIQKLSAVLAAYVREMGADPRLVELAAQTTPWEPIRILTYQEIRDLHIVTDSSDFTKWTLVPAGNGVITSIARTIDAHEHIEVSLYCKGGNHAPLLRVDTYRAFYEKAMEDDLNALRIPEGDYVKIDGSSVAIEERQFSRVFVPKNGVASFIVALSRVQFVRLLRGRVLEAVIFEPHVNGYSLGGEVPLEGARAMVPIAIKNCI